MKPFTRPVTILACLAVALGPLALASSASAVTPSKATASMVVSRSATTLTVTLPKVLPASGGFIASARLVRTGGVPAAGQVVTFTQTGVFTFAPQKAVTDAAGTARMTLIWPKLGPLTVNAYFAGSPTLAPSKATASMVVSRSATTLTVTLPKVLPAGRSFVASARLVRTGGVPVAGQVVTFTQTGIFTFAARQAVTDATGTARMTMFGPRVGPLTVNACFAGSPTLAASKATVSRVVV
jgi:nucleoid DNA-binding protein